MIMQYQNQEINTSIIYVYNSLSLITYVTTTAIKIQKRSTKISYIVTPSLIPNSILVTTNLFFITIILSFWECYINEMYINVTFWDWLFPTHVMPLKSIQVVYSDIFSFLLLNSIPRCGSTSVSLSHLHTVGHRSHFQLWAITNKAAMNICVHVFMWIYVFIYQGWMFRSVTSGSCGKCMFNSSWAFIQIAIYEPNTFGKMSRNDQALKNVFLRKCSDDMFID